MTRVEQQRWIRIRLAVAAYAYEVENDPIISDAEFDKMSGQVEPMIATGNDQMDRFFEIQFDASTGVWIHQHPKLGGIRRIYRRYWARRNDDLA